MLNKKKVIVCVIATILSVLCFSGFAMADTTGYYTYYGFSNYFYATDTIMKDDINDVNVRDDNYFYRRSSDYVTGATYTSRIYCGYDPASNDYMTISNGDGDSHVMCDPYYSAVPGSFVYRLKLNNGSGIKYDIAGGYWCY